jgi:Fur family ferric uptake transcriptional regulator
VLDAALDSLRAGGHRVTSARRAVIQVLVASDRDLTTTEIAASVERSQPDTHLSTVYRTLEALEEAGVVAHAHAHGGIAYQLAERHRQRAECDTCGRIVEIPAEVLTPVARRLRRDHDFELDTNHVPLVGRCADCRQAKGRAPHRHGR